jgi:hypothetical protein
MRIRRVLTSVAIIGAVAFAALSVPTLAGEQVLEFKFVTAPVDVKLVEAPNIEGETLSAGQYFGVAYFKDGRIAVKNFAGAADLRKGSGSMHGYSTYTFEDGSSITASYVGEVKAGVRSGTYTIVSGTASYANATGTGSFASVPAAFKGAVLYTGKFTVTTP